MTTNVSCATAQPAYRRAVISTNSIGPERMLVITGRDVEKLEPARYVPVFANEIRIADDTLLRSTAAPLNVQSERQRVPAASRALMAAISKTNPHATTECFEPQSGDDPGRWLRRATSCSDIMLCITRSNLLVAHAVRAAIEAMKPMFILRSEIEIDYFIPGVTACIRCSVRHPQWRVRSRITPDSELMAGQFRLTAHPGITIVGRACCGQPVVFRIPWIRPANGCTSCGKAARDENWCELEQYDSKSIGEYHGSQADGFFALPEDEQNLCSITKRLMA